MSTSETWPVVELISRNLQSCKLPFTVSDFISVLTSLTAKYIYRT